tara:strand:- start:823 stop:1374 length:552 start_codon:yes stop_codon:yes gene_type:complete
MSLETNSFGFTASSGASAAEKSQYLSFFVQLGGQAQMSDADYVTFRNKQGINSGDIYNQIGAASSSFPFSGGVEPLPKACKLVSVTITGMVEETGIAAVDVDIMKLVFADGATSFASVRTAHTESLTSLTNGSRFNSTTLSIPQTSDTVFATGDTVSLAISNRGGSGLKLLSSLSVVLTFELT